MAAVSESGQRTAERIAELEAKLKDVNEQLAGAGEAGGERPKRQTRQAPPKRVIPSIIDSPDLVKEKHWNTLKAPSKKAPTKVERPAQPAESTPAVEVMPIIEVAPQQSPDAAYADERLAPGKPGEILYAHPSNRLLCWDGHGEEPAWIEAYLQRGGSWSAMKNAAEIMYPKRTRRF